MIPNAKAREVTSKGVTDSGSFGISLKDSAHIMTILRDTLYSDKILAVLREYASNAWDANREIGKADVPIKVTIPTTMDPTLTIEDFGPGLSHEDVFHVYTQYGASTKRDSDQAVGMLGIGSKSGFAYSDSFTVVSRHEGYKRTYVAVLDESNTGSMKLLHEEECDAQTGVQIKIPAKATDIREFVDKARKLFQHFVPRPDINVDLPPLPSERTVLGHGVLNEEHGEWVAVMGCVPYRVNLEQLRGMDPTPDGGVGEFLYDISGVLHFEIGEVEISASREELKYSDKTKVALVKKINALVDEFVRHTLDNLSNSNLPMWDKRIKAQILVRLNLPVPDAYKDIVQSQINLPLGDMKKPKFFLLTGLGSQTTKIGISSNTRLYLCDDKRKLKGFRLGRHDIIVKPTDGHTPAQAKKALEKVMEKIGLVGLPIGNLSSVTWHAVVNGKQVVKQKNKKHNVKSFRLVDSGHFSHPWSKCWEIVKRAPTDEDVFVVIHKFHASYKFYEMYKLDRALGNVFGVQMPPIFGYKDTAAKPVLAEDCKGTEYQQWREKLYKRLAELKEPSQLLPLVRHANSGQEHTQWQSTYRKHCYEHLKTLIKNLGKDHDITRFFVRQYTAQKQLRKIKGGGRGRRYGRFTKLEALIVLNERLGKDEDNEATQQYQALLDRYPLFATSYGGFDGLWDDKHFEKWSYYVHLVDQHEGDSK